MSSSSNEIKPKACSSLAVISWKDFIIFSLSRTREILLPLTPSRRSSLESASASLSRRRAEYDTSGSGRGPSLASSSMGASSRIRRDRLQNCRRYAFLKSEMAAISSTNSTSFSTKSPASSSSSSSFSSSLSFPSADSELESGGGEDAAASAAAGAASALGFGFASSSMAAALGLKPP
ncbi:Os03g0275950 [Oryza sativa Japonica Group]|uniref:Os03g0275950 protein n=1 Tax=Oryza sativa subsp. japonica TaxID=39947 RepID=A0A0P0VWL7_ORYSJ|nr:Os03g0275950 [Oryza sativa Japonica Group]